MVAVEQSQSDITVRLDERMRLFSAVLAATDWPAMSQVRKPHGTHAHARATRKQVSALIDHPAVKTTQILLNKNAPLDALFMLIGHMQWPGLTIEALPTWSPPNWNVMLADFYEKAQLALWWAKENDVWQTACDEATRAFNGVAFKPFLKPFVGEIADDLVFIPNITYPTDQEITMRVGKELICLAPPRLAWGDSPPWPFDEDPAYIHRVALMQYCKVLMSLYLKQYNDVVMPLTEKPLPVDEAFGKKHPTWHEQFTQLFVGAAAALYLEQHVHKREADAYVLMERKGQGLVSLPAAISVLRRYQSDFASGKYKTFADFLPIFPKQLKVANRIVSL